MPCKLTGSVVQDRNNYKQIKQTWKCMDSGFEL